MNRNTLLIGGAIVGVGLIALILRKRGQTDMISRSEFVTSSTQAATAMETPVQHPGTVVSISPQRPQSASEVTTQQAAPPTAVNMAASQGFNAGAVSVVAMASGTLPSSKPHRRRQTQTPAPSDKQSAGITMYRQRTLP